MKIMDWILNSEYNYKLILNFNIIERQNFKKFIYMKTKLYKVLLLVCLSITVNTIFAQQNLTLYNMEVVPQRMYANPAFFPSYSKVNIGLPAISSLYLNFGNSGFRYKDVIRKDATTDSLKLDIDNLISKLAKNNYISTSFQTDLLSFGFAVKKNYFSFNATEKVNMRFRYPKGLFRFLAEGNGGDNIGQELKLNFGIDATHYREYGFGYVRKVNEKLTLGGKFKYLYGMENLSTKDVDVSLTTGEDFSMTARGNFQLQMSGLDSASTENIENDPRGYLLKKKNRGFGVDLGGVYKLTKKITLSASIIDLGFINWKEPGSQIIKTKNQDANFTYEGVEIDDLSGGDPLQDLGDTLEAIFELDTIEGGYRKALATQLYVGGNYNLTEKINAGAVLYAQIFDKKIQPALSLSFNQRLGKWFNYSLAYSIYNRSASNLGVGFGLNIGALQWYVVTDNVLVVFPQAAKNAHLHTGFNLTFGRGKRDKDGDGVKNRKDDCKDIPGLKEFKGCPDTDGDKVPDSKDECPEVAGEGKFKGCPDTDGDGIVDKEDACPDKKGSADFKGCPDSDEDGVPDSEDKCPNKSGDKKTKGCPDSDGDGIIDQDDKCSNTPGDKKFDGCPDTDKDGIQDDKDDCPNVKGDKKNKGCPEKEEVIKVPEKAAPVEVALNEEEEAVLKEAFENLEFKSGTTILKETSMPSFNKLVELMKAHPAWKLRIAGHTDSMGEEAMNMELSKVRAEAVKKSMMDKGIAENRLVAEWYGETRPIADNMYGAGRQKNRRVDLTIFE